MGVNTRSWRHTLWFMLYKLDKSAHLGKKSFLTLYIYIYIIKTPSNYYNSYYNFKKIVMKYGEIMIRFVQLLNIFKYLEIDALSY